MEVTLLKLQFENNLFGGFNTLTGGRYGSWDCQVKIPIVVEFDLESNPKPCSSDGQEAPVLKKKTLVSYVVTAPPCWDKHTIQKSIEIIFGRLTGGKRNEASYFKS